MHDRITVKEIKKIRDKKVKGLLKRNVDNIRETEILKRKAQLLQVEEPGYLKAEGLEKTYKFTQKDILDHIPIGCTNKIFNLSLTAGPYTLDYSLNGRYMLIGGNKGHVASFDWKAGKLLSENFLGEKIYDVQWLHNETLYAVAQKKNTYIYDTNGLEIHSLRKHIEATHLDFLPYHMLLVSGSRNGFLRYQDITTGEIVAELKTHLGPVLSMRQNPSNAIIHLGHTNGTVSLWTPNLSSPAVKMLCHRGPVQSVAINRSGTYMITSGMDGQLKVWDNRKYQVLYEYYCPLAATSVDISQLGLVSVTFGANVNIWKDIWSQKQTSPYMNHLLKSSNVHKALFCPFDDTLGIGHTMGISSILIPGSGEPQLDSFEANPFQTRKQRQESEVKLLLEKLQPDLISLDNSYIGQIRENHSDRLESNRNLSRVANNEDPTKLKKKRRGKSATLRRYLKRQENVIDAKKQATVEKLEREKEAKKASINKNGLKQRKKTAMDRFKPTSGS